MLPGIGILLAASPTAVPPPLYSAAIAWNEKSTHFARASAAPARRAPMAVAVGMLNALRTNQPMAAAVPDPGRANVILRSYLPGENGSCAWGPIRGCRAAAGD